MGWIVSFLFIAKEQSHSNKQAAMTCTLFSVLLGTYGSLKSAGMTAKQNG